jgi:hypothetical protein
MKAGVSEDYIASVFGIKEYAKRETSIDQVVILLAPCFMFVSLARLGEGCKL